MASVKVKFLPSKNKCKEGIIYYQIIQNRVCRQIATDYRLFMWEWNDDKNSVIIDSNSRVNYLRYIDDGIKRGVRQLRCIIKKWESRRVKYTVDDIVSTFEEQIIEQTLFNFMRNVIAQLQQQGRLRTSETYKATLRSIMCFRENRDILLDEIDSNTMLLYEAFLRNRGVSKNTISFYMRILRAVYNRAVEKELTANRCPFKHVYTGIDKTIKRAISLKEIRQIKNLNLAVHPSLDFARDMFLFSFYTRGMSFIDMAYLKKKDLSKGILSYRRRKTGQRLFIKWEKCMQDVVDKYDNAQSIYLLPIIKPNNGCERTQYQNTMSLINRKLKIIGAMVNVLLPLTMYTARHSWASVARNKNVPISVISEGMGHDSEMTTRIYLASLDTAVVDRANSLILNSL
jgi:integrase